MNTIVMIAKNLLLALPVVLFLTGGLMLMRTPDKKRRKAPAWKRIWVLALLIAVAYVACFAGVRGEQSKLEGTMTISLDYADASRGLNPNGTRFNTYDIISDAVLEKAIADAQMGEITPQELRSTLSVAPLEAGDASAEQFYVSTEYVLSYQASEKTSHLIGDEVLLAVADAYYEDYQAQYSRKTNVMELNFAGMEQADYLDQVKLLANYADNVSEYLEMCSEESESYIFRDGETFASLAAKVDVLSKVELERLESYILVNGLSENADQQIAKLNYLNRMKDMTADKNTASYGIRLEAIEMYERDMASIVLIPTRDDDGEFYMSRTKIGVDVFADEAEDYSKNASAAKYVISTNNYAISQLSGSAAAETETAAAKAMIASIQTSLKAFADKGLDMIRDYDSKATGEYLKFNLKPYDPVSGGNLMKYGFLLVVMGVSAGMFTAGISGRKRKAK